MKGPVKTMRLLVAVALASNLGMAILSAEAGPGQEQQVLQKGVGRSELKKPSSPEQKQPQEFTFPNRGVNAILWAASFKSSTWVPGHQVWVEYWNGKGWRILDYAPVPNSCEMLSIVRLDKDIRELRIRFHSPTNAMEVTKVEIVDEARYRDAPNEMLIPQAALGQAGKEMPSNFQGWHWLFKEEVFCQSFLTESSDISSITLKHLNTEAWTCLVKICEGTSDGKVLGETSCTFPAAPEWTATEIMLPVKGMVSGGTYVIAVSALEIKTEKDVKLGFRYDNPYRDGFFFTISPNFRSDIEPWYQEAFYFTEDMEVTIKYGGSNGPGK